VRAFILPAELAGLFEAHRAASTFAAPEDFIFARADGKPYDPCYLRNYVLYPAMDRLKIEREARRYGFHIFRHSAGSILHRKTGDVKLVQEVLGHSRISATADIYVHVEPTVVEYATGLLASEVIGDTVVTQESELVN